MPSLLEEAILDAKLLREAALKTAENQIIEQYSEQVRSAMNALLEQDDPAEDPLGEMENPLSMEEAEGEAQEVKIPEAALGKKITDAIKETGKKDEEGEDIVELDLNALREMAEMEELFRSDEEIESEKETHEEVAEDVLDEEVEVKEGTLNEEYMDNGFIYDYDCEELKYFIERLEKDKTDRFPEYDNLERDFFLSTAQDRYEHCKEESEEEVLQEELVVDITDGDFTGWAGRPEHDRQRQQKINLARLADTKQKEEFAKLQQGMKDLAGISESLKKEKAKLSEQNKTLLETVEALKERLEDTALLNAKLLYQNKVLTNESLNTRQKNSIVESIQKANTTSDAKVIYETLQSAASAGSVGSSRKESLHEAINRPSHTVTRRTTNNDSLLNEMTDRFQLLAGIKKH